MREKNEKLEAAARDHSEKIAAFTKQCQATVSETVKEKDIKLATAQV